MFVVITIQDNVLHEIVGCRSKQDAADALFVDTLRKNNRGYTHLTAIDIQNNLEDGFAMNENGSVCLLDLSNWEPYVAVTCKLCKKDADAKTAHRHGDGWVGECCWDERLRSSE